ncbi:MAG: 16S rRNA (adenine(1518)-N(6)/adenine(1519)-N(6))-dimethyltransferase RsmA, partial [bacterium]
QMDVLQCDFSKIKRAMSEKPLRIIGNLPYNISTPLIFHLLDQLGEIEDMLFMLQKEVALRLAAKPGSRHYGRLSVMTSLEIDCECVLDVPPSAFEPPPKVDSIVIRMRPRKTRQEKFDKYHLSKLVTAAFGQRRKTLRNALKSVVTNDQFEFAEIDSSLRAESISPEDFIRLSNACLR